jgi:hypothetical protein
MRSGVRLGPFFVVSGGRRPRRRPQQKNPHPVWTFGVLAGITCLLLGHWAAAAVITVFGVVVAWATYVEHHPKDDTDRAALTRVLEDDQERAGVGAPTLALAANTGDPKSRASETATGPRPPVEGQNPEDYGDEPSPDEP